MLSSQPAKCVENNKLQLITNVYDKGTLLPFFNVEICLLLCKTVLTVGRDDVQIASLAQRY